MHSMMTWRKVTTILILSALASGCCKSGKPSTMPLVVERSRCLRHEPPPPPDPMTFSDPATELANLYARIEQLEKWADTAWADCKVKP